MHYHKLYLLACLLFFMVFSKRSKGQLFSDYPCYAISHNAGNANVLFKYEVGSATWDSVGVTKAYRIKAMALHPLAEVIYACNGALFGIINPANGDFTSVGLVGLAHNGIYGTQLFDNVVGLTFDHINNVIYGVERVQNTVRNQSDILFKIDPATGKYIPGAFVDDWGNPVDYVRIEHVNDGTEEETILNVEDIAMNPITGELFVTHDQGSPAKITIINPANGNLLLVLIDVNPADISGLTFTNQGVLYGTTVDNTKYGSREGIALIDYQYGAYNFYASVDPSKQNFDFQAIDCYGIAPGCNQSLNLDSLPITKNKYKAQLDITINRVLEGHTSLTLRAGTMVNIDKDFEAPRTCDLTLEIGDCQ